MAKTRRVAKSRISARKPAPVAKKRAQVERRRPASSSGARTSARPVLKSAAPARAVKTAKPAGPAKAATPKAATPKAATPKALTPRTSKPATLARPATAAKPVAPLAPPAPPQPPARKPTYHEAVAMYERGLQALQRRDFAASADALRLVIERYPDERELLERARLYLKVCERELEPKEPTPKTADEWVYAATVALNAGDEANAFLHLQRAVGADARHDHAQYMMAVAMSRRGDVSAALDHLRRAVALNPENRSIARQDPELDSLREAAGFRAALDTPPAEGAAARPLTAVARPLRPRPRR